MLKSRKSAEKPKRHSKVVPNKKLLELLTEAIKHSIEMLGDESDFDIADLHTPSIISEHQTHSVLLTVSTISFKILFVLTIENPTVAMSMMAKKDHLDKMKDRMDAETVLDIIKEFSNNFAGTAKRYLGASYSAMGMSTPHILHENTKYEDLLVLDPHYDLHTKVSLHGSNVMFGSVYFFSSDSFELVLNSFANEDVETGTLDFF